MNIMKMKKYSKPLIEIHRIEVENMMALSMIDPDNGTANPDGEVLVNEKKDWDNIWN